MDSNIKEFVKKLLKQKVNETYSKKIREANLEIISYYQVLMQEAGVSQNSGEYQEILSFIKESQHNAMEFYLNEK